MSMPLAALGAHAFDPAPTTEATPRDKGGKLLRSCRVCGRPGRGSGHRLAGLTGEARALRARRPPREPGAPPEPRPRVAPPARAEARRPEAPQKRRSRRIPARELVVLAGAIDAILELPIDAVGWRLRLRLADIRPILGVETHPTLRYDSSAQPEPEPPSPALLERLPGLQPPVVESPRAASLSILTGIRDDKVKALARRAIEDGWEARKTMGGHLALDRGEKTVIISTTVRGGAGHSWGNIRAEAKRHGIDVSGL